MSNNPLYQALVDDPSDFEAMLVYADYLEESRAPRIAYAFRWAATRRLAPALSPVTPHCRPSSWGSWALAG